MKTLMILLPVLLVAGWMQAPQAEAGETDESAIKAVMEKQTRAFFERNFEAEEDVWAQEPYIIRMSDVVPLNVGWDAISTAYKTIFEKYPDPVAGLDFSFSNVHLNVHGDAAWVVYEQHLKGEFEGEAFSSTSREVRFLTRIDGKWKIVYQFTTNLPREDEA
jgi:ketosteroid isomerase-like protein